MVLYVVQSGLVQMGDPVQTTIHRWPEVGLVAIETSEPVHYYSLFSQTVGFDAVLSIYSGGRVELERYDACGINRPLSTMHD